MSVASSRATAASAEASIPDVSSDSSPDEDRWRQLDVLRAELDRVDDGLHDGLMRRAELVAQVRALGAKGRVPLRPGREAEILRRLLGRNRGELSPATLVRVWREVLAGSSAQQNPMRIVIGAAGLARMVREHFGAGMPLETAEPANAIEQVRQGQAAVAVVSDTGDWWTELAEEGREGRVSVVAKLPFWSRPGGAAAFVVTAAPPDPSGQDRSLIACADDGELAQAGFVVGSTQVHDSLVLADVDGFVTQDDQRLHGLAATVLGAYAVPMGEMT